MMSLSVSVPLSRPEMVIAARSASMRIEKLLLVAGVKPCAPSFLPALTMAAAQAVKRVGS